MEEKKEGDGERREGGKETERPFLMLPRKFIHSTYYVFYLIITISSLDTK